MKKEELNSLIVNSKKFGSDFNGTLTSGLFDIPDNTIVITGVKEGDENYVKEGVSKLNSNIKEIYLNDVGDTSDEAVGIFKAKKIEELGIDLYFDDDPAQIYWIKKFNPKANIVYIHRLNYAIFTHDLNGLIYSLRLKEEGNNVIMGILTPEEKGIEIEPYEKEEQKRTLETGDNLIKKYPAKTLFEYLMKLTPEEKEEVFVDFDFNYSGGYGEKLEQAGFTGIFSRTEDKDMETDRHKAQEFVKKNYSNLIIPEEKVFNKTDDALNYIQESGNIYVVKCNEDNVSAYLPVSSEFEDYLKEVESFFNKNQKELEKDGFILQFKIEQPVEVAPEALFIDGKPLYFMADIEYKKFGAMNCGTMVGCAGDLNFPLSPESKLVEVALKDYFPFAEERKQNNITDAGVLIDRKTNKAYFTEFCQCRKGYNAFMTQLSLLPSVSYYFESVKAKKNPFEDKIANFAASINIFNLLKDKERYSKADLSVQAKGKNVWLWDIKNVDGELYTVGSGKELAIVTGQGETPQKAIENAINNLKDIVVEDMYWRGDMACENEWYCLSNRYNYLKVENWLDNNNYNAQEKTKNLFKKKEKEQEIE